MNTCSECSNNDIKGINSSPPLGNGHYLCDTCQSNFACSRLYMSLKIVESDYSRMEKSSPNYSLVGGKLDAIKKQLSEHGWGYPYASKSCKYSFDVKDTWQELEKVCDLIRSISASRG